MAYFRKKPVVIEAIKYVGENLDEIRLFTGSSYGGLNFNKLSIITLEGNMVANKGDYIIKGIAGEFYPCKPDIFKQTYDKVG